MGRQVVWFAAIAGLSVSGAKASNRKHGPCLAVVAWALCREQDACPLHATIPCWPADVPMDEGGAPVTEPRGGFAGPSGRSGSWGSGAGGRRPLARLQSPPCYRNIFADADSEEPYAHWKSTRPQQQQPSRYRSGKQRAAARGGLGCASSLPLLVPLHA